MINNDVVFGQLSDILQRSIVKICDQLPSEYAEDNIIIKSGGAQGPLRYYNSPYTKEIINCFAQDHPARKITLQKGQQIGGSATIIIPLLLYIMKHVPGPTIFSVGSTDLIKKASKKLDMAIKHAGLEGLLQVEAPGKSNNKTGDTISLKEFIGGWIYILTLNNHDNIRDFSAQYGFLDDLDANSGSSNDFGDTLDLTYGRFSMYKGISKIVQVSTPKFKHDSMIERQYLLGDQRLYFIHCPKCHDPIDLKWQHEGGGGIEYKTENGILIPKSVGYICPKCAKFFDEKNKMQWLNEGLWIQKDLNPKEPDHYSYKVGCLYNPTFGTGWRELAQTWIGAHPNNVRDEKKYQTFLNTWMGETYELPTVNLDSKGIQKNIRPYSPGTIPDNISVHDGNGRIVLLTLGSDLNGRIRGVSNATENDVRLDWEVVAHTESGATYSIMHGSIGTWQRGDGDNNTRQKWTAEHNVPYSIWPELDKVLDTAWIGDNGMHYRIARAGVDTGFGNNLVYAYLDSTRHAPNVLGIRGDKEFQMLSHDIATNFIKASNVRTDEKRVQVGYIKDDIARYMQLSWTPGQPQQPNFMNFPQAADGLYGLENYFEHYESEKRMLTTDKNGKMQFKWEKKNSGSVNHMLDCRVYNMAIRDIIVDEVKQMHPDKPKLFEWPDYVAMVRESMAA